jgi:hypothetical protein
MILFITTAVKISNPTNHKFMVLLKYKAYSSVGTEIMILIF